MINLKELSSYIPIIGTFQALKTPRLSPGIPSRREVFRMASLLGTTYVVARGLAACGSPPPPSPTSTFAGNMDIPAPATVLDSPDRSIDTIAHEIKALEAKYPPQTDLWPAGGEISEAFREDSYKMMELSYELSALLNPNHIPNGNPIEQTWIAFSEEEFNEIIREKDLDQSVIPLGKNGGFTYHLEDKTNTIVYFYNREKIQELGEQGASPMSLMRYIFMHEWEHRISRPRNIPSSYQVVLPTKDGDTTTMQFAAGASVLESLDIDSTNKLKNLEEALAELGSKRTTEAAGLNVIQSVSYIALEIALHDLLRKVGQTDTADINNTLLKWVEMRRDSNLIGIINSLAEFVPDAQQLNDQERMYWGMVIFEGSLGDSTLDPIVESLITDPKGIKAIIEQQNMAQADSKQPGISATAEANIGELIRKYRGYFVCRDSEGRECLVVGETVIFRHKHLPDLQALITNRGQTVPGSFSTVDSRSQGSSPTPMHNTHASFMHIRWTNFDNNWVQVYFDPDEWERTR